MYTNPICTMNKNKECTQMHNEHKYRMYTSDKCTMHINSECTQMHNEH